MTYATPQDLVDRYGEEELAIAADYDGDDAFDTAAVERAIGDASAEIDTYLGALYELPFGEPPAILMRLCTDIAIYRLASNTAHASEERRQRYEDAIALLRRIAKGEVKLGVHSSTAETGGGEGTSAAAEGADFNGPDRLFTRHKLGGVL